MLGVCRGLQLANVLLGGDLVEHVDGHDAGARFALDLHPVRVAEGTLLARATGGGELAVNSLHHQVVGSLAGGLRPSATRRGRAARGRRGARGPVARGRAVAPRADGRGARRSGSVRRARARERCVSGLFAVCGSISADMIGYAPRLPGPGRVGARRPLPARARAARARTWRWPRRASARAVRFFGARGDDQFGEFIGGALAGRGRRRLVAGGDRGHAQRRRADRRRRAGREPDPRAARRQRARAARPRPCGAAVWFCPGEIPRAAHEGTLAAARADGAIAVVNPSPAECDRRRARGALRHRDRQRDRARRVRRAPARARRAHARRARRRAAARGHRAAGGARARGRHDGRRRCVRRRPVRRPGGGRVARGRRRSSRS